MPLSYEKDVISKKKYVSWKRKIKRLPKDQNYNLKVSFYKSRNVSISVRFVFAQVDSRRITSLEGLHKQATSDATAKDFPAN